jgi:hypothetical protein
MNYVQGLDQIMEALQTLYSLLFIDMMLQHPLPPIHMQSFLKWTRTSFEWPLMEFYIICLGEYLQVA